MIRSARAAALALLAVACIPPVLAEPVTVSAVASAATIVDETSAAEVKSALPVEAAKPAAAAAAAAEVARPAPPPPPRMITRIDLSAQRMTVTIDGKPVHSWAISSGRSPGFVTPTGSFRPQWAARMWHSRTYDNAPMPHSVFFNGGIAVHATGATGLLGRPASHGCIRLAPSNAATFFALVHKYGFKATRIIVQGRTPGGELASRGRGRDRIAAAHRAPAAPRHAAATRTRYTYGTPDRTYRSYPAAARSIGLTTPQRQLQYTYRVQPRAYANAPVYRGYRSW